MKQFNRLQRWYHLLMARKLVSFAALILIIVSSFASSLFVSRVFPVHAFNQTSGSFSSYTSAVLADQPSAYYHVDETSGTTASDASGNNYNATYQGSSYNLKQPGIFGSGSDAAVQLAGDNGYLSTANQSTPLPATTGNHDRTVEQWFNTSQTNSQDLFTTGSAGHTSIFRISVIGTNNVPGGCGSPGGTGLYVAFWDDDLYFTGLNFADSQWHYLVVTVSNSGNTVNVFIDGKQPAAYVWNGSCYTPSAQMQPFSMPFPVNTTATPINMGNNSGSGGFNGGMDEVAIYPTPLTATRVAAHYAAASGSNPTPTPSSTIGGGFPNTYPTTCSCAKPVNTATGEFWHHFEDLTVPGRGMALDFNRTYSASRAAQDGPLGHGWTESYQMALTTDPATGNITIHASNGSMVTFTASGSGYQPPSYVLATLVKNGDGTFTYKGNDQRSFVFSAAGQLLKQIDRNGYVTTLTYTGSQLSAVTDPAGRSLAFAYDSNGRITTVSDPASRKVSLTYDSSGNLITATDVSGGVWQFTYDANHLMLTMTDPRKGVLTNIYDSSSRVTSQTDPLGRKTTFAYVTSTGGAETTTMTDAKGNQTLYQYQNLELTSVTKGYGTPQAATTSYTYDAVTLGVTSVIDPNGHTTTATYDARGNQLTSTDALKRTTTNTYDSLNDLLTSQDPTGVTTTLTYDTRGNLTSQSRPLVNTTQVQSVTYHYDDQAHPGDVTSITDANSKTTTFQYDQYGDPIKAVDPLGNTTTSTYNTIGWKLTVTSPKGNVTGCKCAAQYRTTFGRDILGRLTTITDPLKHVSKRHYDRDGNLIIFADANGNKTTYTYDAANELTVTKRADATTVQTTYNLDSTIYHQIDGKGKATTYGYDSLARVTSVTDPLNRTTSMTYDGAGNRRTLTDPQGQVTTYGYDVANQLTSITYSDGKTPNITAITYDGNGWRTGMTDGTGTSNWTWDSLGRISSSTNGTKNTALYGYDLDNHLTSLAYPSQKIPVSRTYDDAGRLRTVKDWLGNTTTFAYDANGNLTTETLPSTTGITDNFAFNNADQLTGIRDAKGTVVFASFTYGRDNNGQLTSEKSTGVPGVPDAYTYNSLNQLSSANTKAYAYDTADNLTKLVSGVTQTYDDANQLCWSLPTASTNTCTTAPTGATIYGYDQRGNRTTVTKPGTAALTLGYDQANHLTSYGTAASYVYDGDGLRANKTVGTTKTPFTWDVAEGLPLLIAEGGNSYVYDPGGLPLEKINSTAVTYFHHDQIGSTRVLTNSTGKVVATYTYDSYGNQMAKTGSGGTSFKFAGEYQDGESGMYYLRARYYDPTTAQFLTRDPLVALTRSPYAYVAGNPLNGTDPSGLVGEQAVCPLVAAPGAGEVAAVVCGGLIAIDVIGLGIAIFNHPSAPHSTYTGPTLDQSFVGVAQLAAPVLGNLWSQCAQAESVLGNVLFAKKQTEKMPQGDNQAANRAFDYVKNKLGLSDSQARRLHDGISGEGLTPSEIEDVARGMFNIQ